MYNIPVVYYHSVGITNNSWSRSFLTLQLPFFQDQIRYISQNYTSISLKEYWQIRNGLKEPVHNSIVITFDDGFLDNWIWAYPILKKYRLKASIFVCPEFVDAINGIRPNLNDVWSGRARMEDLMKWGYLSWEEMKEMEDSGLISIESHTMSHTKHIVSDKIVGFKHKGADILYEVGNKYPERKPYYIEDPEFETILPQGYPLFETKSAIIAKKIEINESFYDICINQMKDFDFSKYDFQTAFKTIEPLYNDFRKNNNLIVSRETDKEYRKRILHEIAESKCTIEKHLNKQVDFLCWPHGDNNEFSHLLALETGYLATTTGSKQDIPDSTDRISLRIGLFHSLNNRFLSKLKMLYRLGSFRGEFPWKQLHQIYTFIRYKRVI